MSICIDMKWNKWAQGIIILNSPVRITQKLLVQILISKDQNSQLFKYNFAFKKGELLLEKQNFFKN